MDPHPSSCPRFPPASAVSWTSWASSPSPVSRSKTMASEAAEAKVIPLGERLRTHRAEHGLSQAQAARELDVARTAYRLWEMEAAKPSPDRWRLIASWLGVSVTTMLLAEDRVSEDEAAFGEIVAFDFGRPGRGPRLA